MAETSSSVFFHSLFTATDPFSTIKCLADNHTEESEWLEFKAAAMFHPSTFSNQKTEDGKRHYDCIKQHWSETLSAFANTGGGVLIWGIDAPRRFAESPSLVAEAVPFRNWLVDNVKNAVQPFVNGVDVCAVVRQESAQGFVVCHVPRSDFVPHRAEWSNKGYFLRVCDTTTAMPIEVLRRMFYPESAPRLTPTAEVSVTQEGGRIAVSVDVRLQNGGSASAEEVYVSAVAKTESHQFIAHPKKPHWQKREYVRDGIECLATIHPGEESRMLSLCRPGTVPTYESLDALPEELRCTFHMYCRHSPAAVAEVVFTRRELVQRLMGTPLSKECIISRLGTASIRAI